MTALLNIKRWLKLNLKKKINVFQIDGGGNFTSLKLKQFLEQNRIHHQMSCPHTPQQNGVAERKHRHLVEIGLALLFQSNMPLKY